MEHFILEIELIPSTCKKNLRTILDPKDWKIISRAVRDRAECTCEICGRTVSSPSKLDCHEQWEYKKVKVPRKKKKKYVQNLVGLQAVCTQCHAVKHIGFSAHRGNYENCVDWFMEKNGATYKEFKEYEQKTWKKYEKRSRHKWKIDISGLKAILIKKGILQSSTPENVNTSNIETLYQEHLSELYVASLMAQS